MLNGLPPGVFQKSKPVFNRLLGIRTFLKAAAQKMGASWSALGMSITALGARAATATAREPLLFGGLARGQGASSPHLQLTTGSYEKLSKEQRE